MPQVSHQTIKLSRGRHVSPEQGACVMELASMLAGERFSDHPRSVSPAIGSFLRGYNDLLDDERRQDLYAYASKTVGTAAPRAVERARAERLIAWGDQQWQRRSGRWLLDRLRSSRARNERRSDPEAAGTYAVRSVSKVREETHAAALALVDELIAMGHSDRDFATATLPLPRLKEPIT